MILFCVHACTPFAYRDTAWCLRMSVRTCTVLEAEIVVGVNSSITHEWIIRNTGGMLSRTHMYVLPAT